MVTSLIKDVLSFAWRHRWFMLIQAGPILMILVVLFEMSGINTMFLDVINQMNEQQGEGEVTAPAIQVGTITSGSFFLFLLYLLGGVYLSALVIHYVRTVFAGDKLSGEQLHAVTPILWLQMVGMYVMIWGGMLCIGLATLKVLNLFGLGQGLLGSFSMTVLFGIFIYVHHRLSLAPYFCANTRMGIVAALKSSWIKAHGTVLVLIAGHFILYFGIILVVSLFGNILQSFLPESMIGGIQMLLSVLAGFGGVLQTIFVYRVYALLTEEKRAE